MKRNATIRRSGRLAGLWPIVEFRRSERWRRRVTKSSSRIGAGRKGPNASGRRRSDVAPRGLIQTAATLAILAFTAPGHADELSDIPPSAGCSGQLDAVSLVADWRFAF